MGDVDKDLEYISGRYREKLKRELEGRASGDLGQNLYDGSLDSSQTPIYSREYNDFREDILPAHFSLYERLCCLSEKIMKVAPNPKKAAAMQKDIDTAHLHITPSAASSLSLLGPLFLILAGVVLSVLVPVLFGSVPSMFVLGFTVVMGLLVMLPLRQATQILASSWRLRASNQMVLCIFYIVTFMRHTSNLELAVRFASNHLTGPLALDLKKVLWDVETQKYPGVKESLDRYLMFWREHNLEFVESMHLIESSLYEGDESRRLELLNKALDVMLEETYEKMLHYAQNLKSPITMLHMLGIIMPVLGLVILPLIVNFMEGVRWYHIALIYNVGLPILVFYLGLNVLATRPTGYGDTDITEDLPVYEKYRKLTVRLGKKEFAIKPLHAGAAVFSVCLLLSLSPLLMHWAGLPDIGFGPEEKSSSCGQKYCFLDFRDSRVIDEESGKPLKEGPFGIGATVLSFFFPLAFGLGVGLYKKLGSKKIMEIRNKATDLEKEFASALFQLGNRLGDGLPAEIAFGRAADSMEGTTSGEFFNTVSINITKQGMSVTEAIFNQRTGAIISFPSKIIQSSMKVLTQAIKKSPRIAAQAVINISRYIKEMHRVNERLKDLLADVISSMKSQISLLAPAISAVVVGISSMISTVLSKIIPRISETAGDAEGGLPSTIGDLFQSGIPPFYFQIIVGLYVVQIIYILTVLANGIENGSDKLNEKNLLGKNLVGGTLKYAILGLLITVIFTLLASSVIDNALG